MQVVNVRCMLCEVEMLGFLNLRDCVYGRKGTTTIKITRLDLMIFAKYGSIES